MLLMAACPAAAWAVWAVWISKPIIATNISEKGGFGRPFLLRVCACNNTRIAGIFSYKAHNLRSIIFLLVLRRGIQAGA
jgi:hypothetical protein